MDIEQPSQQRCTLGSSNLQFFEYCKIFYLILQITSQLILTELEPVEVI